MSESMVERVARAMSVADGFHPEAVSNDEDGEPAWKIYEGMARSAIEAMREPTSWMLNEAVQLSEDQAGNVAGHEYWHRMVDAALKEAR